MHYGVMLKMANPVKILFILSIALSSCNKSLPKVKPVEKVVDIRLKLLESSQSIPDFPKGVEVKLMEFTYVGCVESKEGSIYIVNMFSVLSDMLSPRGQGAIMFYDSEYNHLGDLNIDDYPNPAFCRDGKLFFYGRSRNLPTNSGGEINNGNALDLSDGWDNRKMVDLYEYGSSGGVTDPVPNETIREKERIGWDGQYEWNGHDEQ